MDPMEDDIAVLHFVGIKNYDNNDPVTHNIPEQKEQHQDNIQ